MALRWAILLSLFFPFQFLGAQACSLIIRGARLIDPKNNIDAVLDIALRGDKIVAVGTNLDSLTSFQRLDAKGDLVVPGLIDMHTHLFYGADSSRAFCNGIKSVKPDSAVFRSGITTLVDAGSSGRVDFPRFVRHIIKNASPRVFAFLNIVGKGMRGGAFEQDRSDMDASKTLRMIKRFPQYIVGIKLAHYKGADWFPVQEAIRAGKMANLPVMIDFGEYRDPLSLKTLFFDYMRPGDIYTHCFSEIKGRETITDTSTSQIKAFVWEARQKGILFNVGYGEVSFSFSQAVPAIRAGFFPNSLSTDMHAVSGKKGPADLLEIMSKFLAMGMNVQDIIKTVTWNPAREINHEELGNLSVGNSADLAILSIDSGNFRFYDHAGKGISGSGRFVCKRTIKGGKTVFIRNRNPFSRGLSQTIQME